MRKETLPLVSLLAFSLIITSLPQPASGQGPPRFSTEKPHYTQSRLIYTIDENLAVDAQLDFTLVNEGEGNWTYEGRRTIPTSEVTNIQVQSSPEGRVNHTVERNSDKTTIHINFTIYSGEQLNYTISYKAQGLVSKGGPEHRLKAYLGSIGGEWSHDNLEVVVRGPPEDELFTHEPSNATILGENIKYKTQLDESQTFDGIRGTWYQSPAYFEVTLNELLQNQGAEEIKGINYELVLFNQEGKWQFPALLETPSTLNGLYPGEENNWRGFIEVSTIPAEESREVSLKLIYELKVRDPDLDASDVGSLSEVPEKLEPYLEERDYWPVNDSTMKSTSELAVNEKTNAYSVAKNIVKFVNDQLEYEVQNDRLGALQAYQTGIGDCSEYTDLSITLARAAGLPARASYGWIYRNNELRGHAWPEFYFPNAGWQPADPAWMDTGGIISPGGLRPGPKPPGRRLGKTASAPANSSKTYLSRLDTIHLQRNIRWLNSTESHGKYWPATSGLNLSESTGVKPVSKTKAANDFLEAAELAENRASELLEGKEKENLNSKLQSANGLINQAKNADSPENKIELSKESIKKSNKIIRAESEPRKLREEKGSLISDLPVTLIFGAIVIVWIIFGIGYALKNK